MFLIKTVCTCMTVEKRSNPPQINSPFFLSFFPTSLPIGSFTEYENGQPPLVQSALEFAAGSEERGSVVMSACCSPMIPAYS